MDFNVKSFNRIFMRFVNDKIKIGENYQIINNQTETKITFIAYI